MEQATVQTVILLIATGAIIYIAFIATRIFNKISEFMSSGDPIIIRKPPPPPPPAGKYIVQIKDPTGKDQDVKTMEIEISEVSNIG